PRVICKCLYFLMCIFCVLKVRSNYLLPKVDVFHEESAVLWYCRASGIPLYLRLTACALCLCFCPLFTKHTHTHTHTYITHLTTCEHTHKPRHILRHTHTHTHTHTRLFRSSQRQQYKTVVALGRCAVWIHHHVNV